MFPPKMPPGWLGGGKRGGEGVGSYPGGKEHRITTSTQPTQTVTINHVFNTGEPVGDTRMKYDVIIQSLLCVK